MTDEQDVLAVNQAFYRAFEKKDLEAMTAVWSKGTGSLCVHPGPKAPGGWDAIRDSWKKIYFISSGFEFGQLSKIIDLV